MPPFFRNFQTVKISSFNTLQVLIFLALAVYFLAGLRMHYLLRSNLVPFCGTATFEKVPNTQEMYTIMVRSYGNEVLDLPRFFPDAYEIFDVKRTPPPKYLSFIEEIGKSIERGEQGMVVRWRNELEDGLLIRPVEYDVVKIKYNPVDYLKERKVLELEQLGSFTAQ